MTDALKALACATALVVFALACGGTRAETAASTVDYQSVAEALNALRAKPGVTFTRNGDWTIATDTNGAMWSFTPATHPAHPSVGRRQLMRHTDGNFYVETRLLCQATKAACDGLHADYQLLDRRMTESLRAKK